MLNINKEKIKEIIYLFLIIFIILLLTSKNSFLYPLNDWVDENAFFTMGKSLMNGVVPYRDLYEQKGPLLYLIFGIGYLISNTSFLGVFILEVVSWVIAMIFFYKIIILFLSKRSANIIIPIFVSLLSTTYAFAHGGSAEEFCMPFFFITLYYFIKHFKVKKLNILEMLINGIMAGCVLLIKYTLLGFWIGFTLVIFVDFIKEKDYKKAITYPLILLGGMLIPFGLFTIYFLLNKGFIDFIKVYFISNIFNYGADKVSIFSKVLRIGKEFIIALRLNGIMFILFILLGLSILVFKEFKKFRWYLLTMILITIFFVYYGLLFYRYYVFFILLFICIPLIWVFTCLDKYFKQNRVYIIGISITLILTILNAYFNANYDYMRGLDRNKLFQYSFLDEIKKEKNPTLVNMGFLDSGLYTTSGIVPTTYYFERQNNYKKNPLNIIEFNKYIQNKTTTFIIYYTKLDLDKLKDNEELLFNNYQLIKWQKQRFEERYLYAYLFKRI